MDKAQMEDSGYYLRQETRCGVFGWRPKFLQVLANIRAFTATVGLITIFANINLSYYTAVITQIEKQFGLSSSMTGFLKNVDNIGYLSIVLFVSHFCRYSNKPRLFSVCTVLVALAVAMFSLPHFIYGRGIKTFTSNTTYNISDIHKENLCRIGADPGSEDDICNRRSTLSPFNVGAFAIFIASEILQGMASSPKGALSMTYMDDNAGQDSPKYFGFMFAARSISPILGFLLGAWCISKYVDLSETDLTPRDPRWVGAWWLGFIICAGCAIVWAVPLAFFPPMLKEEQEKRIKAGQTEPPPSMIDTFKDLPHAFFRILSNKIYLILLLALTCEVNTMGYAVFIPKYLENQFRASPGLASVITGSSIAASFAIGPVISGFITSKVNPHPHSTIRLVTLITIITLIGYIIKMFLGCDQDDFVGNMEVNKINITAGCNQNCTCDDLDYSPVCGDDHRTYFSPCHAGCLDVIMNNVTKVKTFTGCTCVPGGQATSGLCPPKCNMLIPFTIVNFLTYLVGSMGIIPMITTFMRCVDDKDKAISLAGVTFWMSVASFPSPLLFGMVIDSTCLIHQSSCDRKGACLLYENDTFRFRLHGFAIGVKIVVLIMYIIGLFISRGYKLKSQNEKDAKNKEELKELNLDVNA